MSNTLFWRHIQRVQKKKSVLYGDGVCHISVTSVLCQMFALNPFESTLTHNNNALLGLGTVCAQSVCLHVSRENFDSISHTISNFS